MAFTIGSTLALLSALDTGRRRWWVIYAVCACAALLCHYTCGFVLAGQGAVGAVDPSPAQRRPLLMASAGAPCRVPAVVPGLRQRPALADHQAALRALAVSTRITSCSTCATGRSAIPTSGSSSVPGPVALAGRRACAGSPRRRQLRRDPAAGAPPDPGAATEHRVVLLIALVLATPIGEALISASGDHIFGTRNLAASWPALVLARRGPARRPGPPAAPAHRRAGRGARSPSPAPR